MEGKTATARSQDDSIRLCHYRIVSILNTIVARWTPLIPKGGKENMRANLFKEANNNTMSSLKIERRQ